MKDYIVPPQLLTVKQAAKALQVSEKTLWTHSAPRGKIPTVRIGGRVLYDFRDLLAFIDSQKQKGDVQ